MAEVDRALFQELVKLFKDQISKPVTKEDAQIHATIVHQVCSTCLNASSHALDTDLPLVLDLILLDIAKRPQTLLENPQVAQSQPTCLAISLSLTLIRELISMGSEKLVLRTKVESCLVAICRALWSPALSPHNARPIAKDILTGLVNICQNVNSNGAINVFAHCSVRIKITNIAEDGDSVGSSNQISLTPAEAKQLCASLIHVLCKSVIGESETFLTLAFTSNYLVTVTDLASSLIKDDSHPFIDRCNLLSLVSDAPMPCCKPMLIHSFLSLIVARLRLRTMSAEYDGIMLVIFIKLIFPRSTNGKERAIPTCCDPALMNALAGSISYLHSRDPAHVAFQRMIILCLLLPSLDGQLWWQLQDQDQRMLCKAYVDLVHSHPELKHCHILHRQHIGHKRKRQDEEATLNGEGQKEKVTWKAPFHKLLDTFNLTDIQWATTESLESLVGTLSVRLRATTDPLSRKQLTRTLELIPCFRSGHVTWLNRGHREIPMCWSCDLEEQYPVRTMPDSCLKTLVEDIPKYLLAKNSDVVQRSIFPLLVRYISHLRPGFEISRLAPPPARNVLADYAMESLTSIDASIRHSAGSCLVALAALHHDGRPARKDSSFERVLKKLDTIANPQNRNKRTFRESAIIALGAMARFLEESDLHLALTSLVMQLGRQSDPLASIAQLQIFNLAKTLQVPCSRMLAPFLPRILRTVFERDGHTPQTMDIIRALSALTGIGLATFMKQHIADTIPALIVQGRHDAIEYWAQVCEQKAGDICVDHAAEIVAYLYLCNPNVTKEGLFFLENYLKGDLQTVFTICAAPLLFHLVVELGDSDEKRCLLAHNALQRLDRDLHVQELTRPVNIQNLLCDHLLGILTMMNDSLSDFRYKRSLEEKEKILRGLAALITAVGTQVSSVTPQVMATLQSSLSLKYLENATLEAWAAFINSMKFVDIAPFVGQTSAAFASKWNSFSEMDRVKAKEILEYLILDNISNLKEHMNEIASFEDLNGLQILQQRVEQQLTALHVSPEDRIRHILARVASENQNVCLRALKDLRFGLVKGFPEVVSKALSGDSFDGLVAQILKTVIGAAHRAGEEAKNVRDAAFDVIGFLGAADPDRMDWPKASASLIVARNFEDSHENASFAINLIVSILANNYQASNDTKHQSALAFAIQELLKFCGFKKEVALGNANSTRVRAKWATIPESIKEIIVPLLDSKFTIVNAGIKATQRPIYNHAGSFRDWIKTWTLDLISCVVIRDARKIFESFCSVVKSGDVAVARKILPHIVLHLLISSKISANMEKSTAEHIKAELLAILTDQVDSRTPYSSDARLLCAQVVFDVLDHLSSWLRIRTVELAKKTNSLRKASREDPEEIQAIQAPIQAVQDTLKHIPQDLQARAALKCKAYARSLMNFESRLMTFKKNRPETQMQEYYDSLHQIYAELEEPDGMEGISIKILSPTLSHQIREHEVLGKWTSAQSCWELELQKDPSNINCHIGLLKCLRNLGHFDSMRTHVNGLLSLQPQWRRTLASFEVEGAFIAGDYEAVESVLALDDLPTCSEITFARVLSAIKRNSSSTHIVNEDVYVTARTDFGINIAAAGQESYRRVYESVLRLHILEDIRAVQLHSRGQELGGYPQLKAKLDERLNFVSPAFRTREAVLAMRRAAFELCASPEDLQYAKESLWMASAKIARKAGHQSSAYSAILRAESVKAPFAFVESAKLLKVSGEARQDQALRVLEVNIDRYTMQNTVPDTHNLSKALLLRARWMVELDRHAKKEILEQFDSARQLVRKFSAPAFYLGRYYDSIFKASLQHEGWASQVTMSNASLVVKNFLDSLKINSKYIYQSLPRLLTIVLEFGAMDTGLIKYCSKSTSNRAKLELEAGNRNIKAWEATLRKVCNFVRKALEELDAWNWLVVLQQLVSRINHQNELCWDFIEAALRRVTLYFPHQAIWAMISVVKSSHAKRSQKCRQIFDKVRSTIAPKDASRKSAATTSREQIASELYTEADRLVDQFLRLANFDLKSSRETTLSAQDHFADLVRCMPCRLIVPLQESLTISSLSMAAEAATKSKYRPFPKMLPAFKRFDNEIEIMSSLIRPKKFTCHATDGMSYSFLCKPQDDLRKDARLMEFNSVINKLLKKDSEARKRHLHIRTYAVVPINEECGLIQWVKNTGGMRHILNKLYEAKGISAFPADVKAVYDNIRDDPNEIASKFEKLILTKYPPVFHEWFLESFPEPTTWLTNRQAYSRTCAVMSMVGFVLGLGDRHGENILLDNTNGDVLHVDFNCLFDKGHTFEVPEQVPFRLTHNMIDGFGITGYEGVFRRAAEVTLHVLRSNQEALMNVVESFLHDPLLEWSTKKKRKDKHKSYEDEDAQYMEAKRSLNPVSRKLKGLQISSHVDDQTTYLNVSSIENQVEALIKEATDPKNLGSMYIGWTAHW